MIYINSFFIAFLLILLFSIVQNFKNKNFFIILEFNFIFNFKKIFIFIYILHILLFEIFFLIKFFNLYLPYFKTFIVDIIQDLKRSNTAFCMDHSQARLTDTDTIFIEKKVDSLKSRSKILNDLLIHRLNLKNVNTYLVKNYSYDYLYNPSLYKISHIDYINIDKNFSFKTEFLKDTPSFVKEIDADFENTKNMNKKRFISFKYLIFKNGDDFSKISGIMKGIAPDHGMRGSNIQSFYKKLKADEVKIMINDVILYSNQNINKTLDIYYLIQTSPYFSSEQKNLLNQVFMQTFKKNIIDDFKDVAYFMNNSKYFYEVNEIKPNRRFFKLFDIFYKYNLENLKTIKSLVAVSNSNRIKFIDIASISTISNINELVDLNFMNCNTNSDQDRNRGICCENSDIDDYSNSDGSDFYMSDTEEFLDNYSKNIILEEISSYSLTNKKN